MCCRAGGRGSRSTPGTGVARAGGARLWSVLHVREPGQGAADGFREVGDTWDRLGRRGGRGHRGVWVPGWPWASGCRGARVAVGASVAVGVGVPAWLWVSGCRGASVAVGVGVSGCQGGRGCQRGCGCRGASMDVGVGRRCMYWEGAAVVVPGGSLWVTVPRYLGLEQQVAGGFARCGGAGLGRWAVCFWRS